jgi:hypothetical protein
VFVSVLLLSTSFFISPFIRFTFASGESSLSLFYFIHYVLLPAGAGVLSWARRVPEDIREGKRTRTARKIAGLRAGARRIFLEFEVSYVPFLSKVPTLTQFYLSDESVISSELKEGNTGVVAAIQVNSTRVQRVHFDICIFFLSPALSDWFTNHAIRTRTRGHHPQGFCAALLT